MYVWFPYNIPNFSLFRGIPAATVPSQNTIKLLLFQVKNYEQRGGFMQLRTNITLAQFTQILVAYRLRSLAGKPYLSDNL